VIVELKREFVAVMNGSWRDEIFELATPKEFSIHALACNGKSVSVANAVQPAHL
jgi:hypothetical protein